MSLNIKGILKDLSLYCICFSHLIEYSEYDNMDYDKIYMTNLSKNVTTFEYESAWSNFHQPQNVVKKINKLKGIQVEEILMRNLIIKILAAI